MATLILRCLGPLEVLLGPWNLTGYGTQKERALLVYLACDAGRAFPREHLRSLLWGESPSELAARSLRQALVIWRHVLPDEYLQICRGNLAFNDDSDHDLDVARFEADPGNISQYRGSFLLGMDLSNAPVWEDWLRSRREALQALALDTLEALGRQHEAGGDYRLAAKHYRRALEIDPWRESAEQALMRVSVLAGDRADALAQYEQYRATLARGLGVEPMPATQDLYRLILEGNLPTWEKDAQ